MDAEVAHAALEQERADGVRHGADADLQAIAVLDLGGDEPARRRRRRRGPVDSAAPAQGPSSPSMHVVHFADVDAGLLAVDVGQLPARLDDDRAGALDDGAMPQVGGAQIEVAVLVHRTGLEDDDVGGRHEAPVVVGDLAEIDRDVVAASLVVLLPVVAGEMQAERVDVLARPGSASSTARGRMRQAVADLDVRDLADAGGERAVEHDRAGPGRCRSPATCPR